MKIHDVEQLLGISKANIRFYEKQGLLLPKRSENRYREYSDADVERLKSIIILRKLGIPVQKIGSILDGEFSFQDAIRENITDLETQIRQLEGALNLSRQIVREQEEALDTPRYWEIIQKKEAEGEKFADVVSEYWSSIGYPLLARKFCIEEGTSTKQIIIRIVTVCLAYALLSTHEWNDGSFWINLLHYPIVILFGSAITFFLFWVGKHHPKIGMFLNVVLLILCVVVLGGALLLLIGGALVALWNWIF